jgi:hypothetical protein
MGGGKDGAKQKFVQEKYNRHDVGKGDRLYCILTDKEPVRTFACWELTSQNGKKYENQSFYVVTQKGFSWLWLEICSDNFFKNQMISRTIKNDVLQFAAQPSQISEECLKIALYHTLGNLPGPLCRHRFSG